MENSLSIRGERGKTLVRSESSKVHFVQGTNQISKIVGIRDIFCQDKPLNFEITELVRNDPEKVSCTLRKYFTDSYQTYKSFSDIRNEKHGFKCLLIVSSQNEHFLYGEKNLEILQALLQDIHTGEIPHKRFSLDMALKHSGLQFFWFPKGTLYSTHFYIPLMQTDDTDHLGGDVGWYSCVKNEHENITYSNILEDRGLIISSDDRFPQTSYSRSHFGFNRDGEYDPLDSFNQKVVDFIVNSIRDEDISLVITPMGIFYIYHGENQSDMKIDISIEK